MFNNTIKKSIFSDDSRYIYYSSGYKYQLTKEYKIKLKVKPTVKIDTPFITFHKNGLLVIKYGYAWDGPSGPTFDTKDFMRGSLIHDALYQLIREEYLPMKWRRIADDILYDICREDEMNFVRSWLVYLAVRIFGRYNAKPTNEIEIAP